MPAATSACSAALRLVAGRQRVRRPGREADAPVAEREQMLGRELAGRTLVDPDRRDLERVGGAVHEHEPRSLVSQAARSAGGPSAGR